MKKIIAASLISACLVVLIGGGVGFYLVKSGKLPHLPAAEAAKTDAPINPANLTFISMPETVVTLNDSNGIHHYVVIELALAVSDKDKQSTVRDDESLYQSIIVSALSLKSFDDIQYMKVPEIRDLLANALKSELQNRHMEQPFCDVLVTKAVFQ